MTNNNKHHHCSIRLPYYDYADVGAYFVTICTHERVCLFGHVDMAEGAMTLNTFGRMVWDEWEQTAALRENVTLDRFVVMPNHVHGILWITEKIGQENPSPQNDVADSTKNVQHVGSSDVPAKDKLYINENVGAWRDIANIPVHGETDIHNIVGAQRAAPLQSSPGGVTPNNVKSGSLGAIVRAFKSAVTKRINRHRNTSGARVWQRNYWERVIRNDDELNAIHLYIDHNPAQWQNDKLYISKSDN
jgi:REP element-mobilizing transposase RayT